LLQPFLQRLHGERIILASGSPRRKQILENIGLKIDVIPSKFEENLDKSSFEFPYDYVKRSAHLKALDTLNSLVEENSRPHPFLVIGADTIVTLDRKIIEKPQDKQHAFDMLSSLSSRSHIVYTGVTLMLPRPEFADLSLPDNLRFDVDSFHAATDVEFDDLNAETIWAYVESGEPMDKAGGYGIQAVGGTLVKGIHGDYFNVMGFPLNMFANHLVDICRKRFC
jgi:septum formation protein